MRTCLFTVVVGLALSVLVIPGWAAGETLHHFEVWRSDLGYGYGLALNPTDGTAWACMGDSLYHYGTDNTLLSKTELWWPTTPCVNVADGSCWVVEAGLWWDGNCPSSLVQVAADGTELQEGIGLFRASVADAMRT